MQLSKDIIEQVELVTANSDPKRASKGPVVTGQELLTYLDMWASGITKREIAEAQGVDFLRVQNAMAKMLDMTEVRKLRNRFPKHAYNRIKNS
jgi:hypothetical protein